MKKYLKLLLITLVISSICGISSGFAADFCEEVNKKVVSIASFFNSNVKGYVGQGEFEVHTLEASKGSNLFNIIYKITNQKAYQYEYRFEPPEERNIIHLELSATPFGGISGLLFNYRILGDITYTCPYIIIPQSKRFSIIKINKNGLSVEYLDKDNDTELVDWEPEEWSAECQVVEIAAETHDGLIYWPKVFHLDPKNGTLVDVSQRFPQFYKNHLAERYPSEIQQKVKNSTETLPKCKANFFDYINRLQKASGEAKVQAGEKFDFSGTWSGYRIISGQKRYFNLVIKQNNNKIEGISTDTLTLSDGNKTVQGTVSGDISDMRIQFKRKWIDHPKGMTGETDFSGTMDRETGTVTGTFKINDATGEWAMERKTIDVGLSSPKTSLPANIPATEGNLYEGIWVGTYSCRQGITGLQLQLNTFSQDRLAGGFSFFPVSSNPNVHYGSFNVNAMVRKDGKLIVRHGNWIQKPRGFSAVNLEGQISSDSQSISGRVLTYGCSGFMVQRKNE